jgi:NAD+ kinase
VRAFADHPLPTLGINLGRVGFLASTPASRWKQSLTAVLDGRAELEPRTRLEATFASATGVARCVALNEVILQRSSQAGMLVTTLRVDEVFVTHYRADGVIVATPSGSTAYSLSAGGPILTPSVPGLVVTPICSQGLSTRPLVLHEGSVLGLRVGPDQEDATLAIDGQEFQRLPAGTEVRVQRHPAPYPLYVMPGLDPYRRLRERLGWRGSVEPDGPEPEPQTQAPLI